MSSSFSQIKAFVKRTQPLSRGLAFRSFVCNHTLSRFGLAAYVDGGVSGRLSLSPTPVSPLIPRFRMGARFNRVSKAPLRRFPPKFTIVKRDAKSRPCIFGGLKNRFRTELSVPPFGVARLDVCDLSAPVFDLATTRRIFFRFFRACIARGCSLCMMSSASEPRQSGQV